MCLIIASIFGYLGYNFFIEDNYINASINLGISLAFIFLMIRNIIKTKKERSKK
jgi:hypothetical protein